MSIETTYHPKWQKNRIEFLAKRLGVETLKDKTVADLGSHNGYIGNWFSEQGAIVTCIEGRKGHCEAIKANFPHMTVIQADLDSPKWTFGKFDIILNMGLLYHLEKFHAEHLINCIANCNLMVLETVITEGKEPLIKRQEEKGEDQSLSDVGGDPTIAWVEKVLQDNGCTFTREVKEIKGAGPHHYTEAPTDRFSRCMWIVTPPQV